MFFSLLLFLLGREIIAVMRTYFFVDIDILHRMVSVIQGACLYEELPV